MPKYSAVAWERAMKVQEVILRAMAKKLTWWQAAEIIGLSDRSMRRWHLAPVGQGAGGVTGGSATVSDVPSETPAANRSG